MQKDDSSKITRTSKILSFPRRRGRPRKNLPKKDYGTAELISKRASGETKEALDLCLERGLITPFQHWCGIHLRWLYTLRYGAPGVRAVDPTHLGGMEIASEDPEWRMKRESEYHIALGALHKAGVGEIIMSICVYDERPDFLRRPLSLVSSPVDNLQYIKKGLDVLVSLWGRNTPKI